MGQRPRRRAPVGRLWRAELARGQERAAAGDAEGARAAYVRAHGLAPGEAEPAFALGREEERRGRLAEAERLYRLAQAARPGWPLAAAALARLVAGRGRPTPARALDEARRVLAGARTAEPEHPLLWAVEGELHLVEEHADEARAAFERARAGGADAAVVAVGLARAANLAAIALARDGRDDEAAFAFKRACDLHPTWAPPRANLAALLQRMGRRPQALAQYRRALALDPQHGPAWFNLGLLLRERGDLDGAADAFRAAATADPPHGDARLELALLLGERGEHARAIALFEEELRHGGRAPAPLYTNLGAAFVGAGDLGQAAAALERALAHAPGHVPALRNLAHVYARTGRLVEAAALLRRALDQGNSAPPPASK
jgi:tetratricopeptide (TPR) repeat protein